MLYQRHNITLNNNNQNPTTEHNYSIRSNNQQQLYSLLDSKDHSNYENDDDEERRRRRTTEIFEKSYGLAQFFVNPCLFLWLRFKHCHKLKIITRFLILCCCRKLLLRPFSFLSLVCLLLVLVMNTSSKYEYWMNEQEDESLSFKTSIPIVINLYKIESHGETLTLFHRNTLKIIQSDIISKAPDYGNLDLTFPLKFERVIHQNDYNDNNHDDTKIYKYFEFTSKTKCNDVNWRHISNPNCNFFHEMNIKSTTSRSSEEDSIYINSGFYRDVFLIQNNNNDVSIQLNEMALKLLRLEHNITSEAMFEISTDALIMERLTSSLRIMNIYGYCSTSVATEFVHHEIENIIVPNGGYDIIKLDKDNNSNNANDNNPSQNKLNATEKLHIAYEMALSIADLHGFHDGIIVHDDIQLRQWLRREDDGRLILGDFNRARILRWNDVDNVYCKFRTGTAFGDVSFSFFLILCFD